MQTASERFGIEPAETGLGPVQDLLNTYAHSQRPDLLETAERAADWVRTTLPECTLNSPEEAGLESLRELRDQLRKLLGSGEAPAPFEASVGLVLSPDGQIEQRPLGAGWGQVVAALLARMRIAQLDGSWSRLKVCRNPKCAVAFYDRSKNRSAVWHDVHVCGNAANLRAARARRRAS